MEEYLKKIKLVKNEKLYSIFFKEIAEILNKDIILKKYQNNYLLITLIKLKINYNKNEIKAYISIISKNLNNKNINYNSIIKFIRSNSFLYKKELFKRLRYRVKKIPKLIFILN